MTGPSTTWRLTVSATPGFSTGSCRPGWRAGAERGPDDCQISEDGTSRAALIYLAVLTRVAASALSLRRPAVGGTCPAESVRSGTRYQQGFRACRWIPWVRPSTDQR
jgi:hypothetical protein